MIYERIAYMCPKCNQGHFFDKAKNYSTICPSCNVEMVCITTDFVDSEEEKRKSEAFQRKLENPNPLVKCPYCQSIDTKKITTTSKAVHTALFGIFSISRNSKQWHCNQCGSDF